MGQSGMAKETFCLMAAMSIVQFPPHIGHVVLSGRILSTFRFKLSVLPAVRSSFSEYCGQQHHPRQIRDDDAARNGGRSAWCAEETVEQPSHCRRW